jgi:hypothetical protein
LRIWPPLWSSGQSSWLQIQRSWSDSRRCQSFRAVVGLERGPFSLVCTIKKLLERKNGSSGLENRDFGRRTEYGTAIYPQKVSTNFADHRRSLGRGLSHRVFFFENVIICFTLLSSWWTLKVNLWYRVMFWSSFNFNDSIKPLLTWSEFSYSTA